MNKLLMAVLLFASICGFAQEPKADDLYKRARVLLTAPKSSSDVDQGRELLRQASEMGYMPAQTALGTLYHVSDPQQARKWYEKAAQQGSQTSAWSLGSLFVRGALGGGNRDLGEKWLAKAADAGNPFGAYLLGASLADRDAPNALKYFRVAAEQGLPFGQFRLGELLLHGSFGVPVNKKEAYFWLLLSRDGVNGVADSDLSGLEGDLGSADADAIRARAVEQRDKFSRAANAHGCTGWDSELMESPGPPPLELQKVCGY